MVGRTAVDVMKYLPTVSVGVDSYFLVSIAGILLQSILSCRGDSVHCYCNSPRCVGYSYMCASEYGCFTQVTTDPSQYSRGCVEDLTMIDRCLKAEEDAFKRLNRSLIRTSETLDLGVPILSCCYDDMCNYANYDQRDKIGDNAEHDQLINQEMSSLSSKAVWFRAAVIAVPVAGICILILLAMLASRLLSADKPTTFTSHMNNHSANNYMQKRTTRPVSLPTQDQLRQNKRALYLHSTVPINENFLNSGAIRNSLPADFMQENLRFQERYEGESEGLLSSSRGANEAAQYGLPKCPNDASILPHQLIKSQYYPANTDKLQIV